MGYPVSQKPQSKAGIGDKTEEKKPVDGYVAPNEHTFRLLVESIKDYAIFLLDKEGVVKTWNTGAEQIKGYKSHEIIGQHFSRFYPQEARESGWPERELQLAAKGGRFIDEGWRVRKDGSSFWAYVVITALRSGNGELLGFSKITGDLTARRKLEERTQELNRQLSERVRQLSETQRQVELQTRELQRLSGAMVRIQDDERRRLARELHDDLGQHLAVLKMTLDISGRRELDPRTAEAIELTEQALSKVRNLSYLLHPPLLDESGLLPAMHWYIDGLEKRSQLRIALDFRPTPFARLPGDIETAVFRIVQEALTNVYRHSGSKDARIEIRREGDEVIVRVRDFGQGVPSEVVARPLSTGVGIAGIHERVKQFGGKLIVSRAEPGTLVEASIPLFQLGGDE